MASERVAARRIRVLLVDDSPAVLRHAAAALPDAIEVVEMLESGERLAEALAAHAPDVIVLDITLPGESGLAIAASLARSGCAARIVFLTVHEDPDYVRTAFAAGGCGYVLKMRLAADLEAAVRAAAHGLRFISPGLELDVD